MQSIELTPEQQIADLKKKVKQLEAKLADYGLALALLKEVEDTVIVSVPKELKSWLKIRWEPGLKLLGLKK